MPIRLLTVGAPAYLHQRGMPRTLADLSNHDCIRLRSATTGRLREWAFVIEGETVAVPVDGRLVLTDLDAICDAAIAGMGLAMLGAHQVLPYLDDRRLVRVLSQFPATGGCIYVYYAHYRLTPPKVRAFIDFLTESFTQRGWLARVSAFG
jgi:DNA-binding transcriptional LysR family regulator